MAGIPYFEDNAVELVTLGRKREQMSRDVCNARVEDEFDFPLDSVAESVEPREFKEAFGPSCSFKDTCNIEYIIIE